MNTSTVDCGPRQPLLMSLSLREGSAPHPWTKDNTLCLGHCDIQTWSPAHTRLGMTPIRVVTAGPGLGQGPWPRSATPTIFLAIKCVHYGQERSAQVLCHHMDLWEIFWAMKRLFVDRRTTSHDLTTTRSLARVHHSQHLTTTPSVSNINHTNRHLTNSPSLPSVHLTTTPYSTASTTPDHQSNRVCHKMCRVGRRY